MLLNEILENDTHLTSRDSIDPFITFSNTISELDLSDHGDLMTMVNTFRDKYATLLRDITPTVVAASGEFSGSDLSDIEEGSDHDSEEEHYNHPHNLPDAY